MPARILVVDDDPDILEVTRFAVEKAGFGTAFASDGLAAISAYQTEKPDLIVLDIGLPEKDGLEVCREIRRDVSLDTVPIMVLSARGEEVDKVAVLELGADDYMVKPFAPRELVARAKRLVARAAMSTASAQPVDPSYMDALATSMPDNIATCV